MANAKISNDTVFVPETSISNIDGLAGFTGTGNVKISGANLITSLESNMSLSNISGTLSVTKGGTGQTSYVDGELLIGNTTGNTLAKATLTQGTDLSITNGNGSISIGHANVANTPGSNSTTLSAGGNFTAINSVTVSAQGHLTAQNTETYTLPSDSDTTYAISAGDGDNNDEEKIVLTASGSGSGTSTVVLEAGTGLTVARSTDKITFTNSSPNQATPAANDGSPSTGQLQYNNGSNGFAASANLTYATDTLTVQDNIVIKGDGSSDASKLKFNCYNNNHHVEIIGPDHSNSPLSYSITLPNKIATQSAVSGGRVLEVNASGVGNWIATPTDTDTSIYAANGALTGAREVTMGTHNLTFKSTTAGQEVKFEQNVEVAGQGYTDLYTGATIDSIDWDNGNVQEVTLANSDSDFDPSDAEPGATYILIIKQPASGAAGTISWGGGSGTVRWPGGTPPILSTANNAVDIVTLVCVNSNSTYYATSVLNLS